MKELYESPLNSRYASEYLLKLFSAQNRIRTWRRLWVSLANAESKLGLPVSEEQVKELKDNVDNIDFEVAAQKEKEIRHDVMAHIYAYGVVAPSAKGIIHLGATSCYVTDNADLIIYRDALNFVKDELAKVIDNLLVFADKYKALPTLGYTHYQPAQLVTVGKRATLWAQDFLDDYKQIDNLIKNMKLLGSRGTTGTEASFLDLFNGDASKIDEMNQIICDDFGFESCFDVAGQTYPRKEDSKILKVLSLVAESAYRMAEDIRLLQHDRQVEEPFEKSQVGSSAMAYKRNPMRCERICSLARYLISDVMNASLTAATQWLERTLDDSANRRISMPEGFLSCDAILRLCQNVTNGLVVNEEIVKKATYDYLPFIATENILMEGVKRGGNRQELHEIIRTCSMDATSKMKKGEPFDLLASLAEHKEFGLTKEELSKLLDPNLYIGRCVEQVERFVKNAKEVIGEVTLESAEIGL